MSSVRKRILRSGEIRWQADYKDQQGTRRAKQFMTKQQAVSYETHIRGEIAAGTHVAASASITVAKAGEEWLERCELEQLEASTIRQYRQHLNLHILPRLGSTKLSELTKPMVESFRDRLLKEKSRPLTRAIVTSLKGLLKEAHRRGRVGQNVAAKTEVTHAGRAKKRVVVPTKAELKAMVKRSAELWPLTRIQTARDGEQRITPVPWRPLVVTALFSGLRLSELRGLTWRHVNLKGGIIEVRQRADFRNDIGNPKSEAGTRDVPIPPAVTQLLREWRMPCPKTADGLVFPTENGTVIYTSNIHQQCWRPLLRALGLMNTGKNEDGEEIEIPRYTFHHLRHAAASLFIEQGFSPKKLQAIMGHSSIQVTYDIYGHLWKDAESDARAVAQIEANLLG